MLSSESWSRDICSMLSRATAGRGVCICICRPDSYWITNLRWSKGQTKILRKCAPVWPVWEGCVVPYLYPAIPGLCNLSLAQFQLEARSIYTKYVCDYLFYLPNIDFSSPISPEWQKQCVRTEVEYYRNYHSDWREPGRYRGNETGSMSEARRKEGGLLPSIIANRISHNSGANASRHFTGLFPSMNLEI